MDLFDDLDDFLSCDARAPFPESPTISLADNLDDSEEIVIADTTKPDQTVEHRNNFAPAKGQKTALKRLRLIQKELDIVAEPSPEKRKRLSVETVRNNVGLDEETAQQIHTIVAEKAMAQRSSAARSNGPRSRRRAGRNHCIQDDDVIDLVNSPYLMMPGTVSLDSDEELDEIRKKADVGVSSPQLDTIAINVKVKYRSTIEEFSFRRHQKLVDLRKLIAEKFSVQENTLLLLFNEKLVNIEDTLHKVGYSPGLMFSARAMEDAPVVAERRKNEDEIVLKVQSAFWRKGRELRIGKSEPMRVLILMCAEELKCDANSIKLVFDGDVLEPHQTAEDHDLEGGEVVDIHMK